MKEDFKKYSLFELLKLLPFVQEEMDEWIGTKGHTKGDIYQKWMDVRSRILSEIGNRI